MRLSHIAMLIMSLAWATTKLAAEEIWQEANGILIMEAEKGTPETSDRWETRTDVADYRGDGFIRWMGSNYFNDKTHGILSYRFVVSNPGTYHLRLRSFHDPIAHGTTIDQENDCWTNYQLNGTAFYKTFRNGSTAGQPWSFNSEWEPTHGNFQNPTLNLTAGEHVFRIAARSQNYMIDRIYLVKSTSNLNANLPESSTSSGSGGSTATNGTVSGELRKWHKVTIAFDGPQTSESASPNPFTDYRLDVTFTNGAKSYVVPGYYAADGDAANTGASSGNTWLVHFTPDETGTWNYSVSFKSGSNVAMNGGGSSAGHMDGGSGSFSISNTNKTGRDHRAKGRLQYVGEHFLRFAETGEYFLKQGPDAPENFLAYADFDGGFKSDGISDHRIKTWSAHVSDWNSGDPTWAGGKGKGIIGSINYLASEEMNAFSFLTMNINGDDKNVFPYLTTSERYRMDVSRLAQWDKVFEHGDHKGMYLHFKTQETENDQLLDGGALGNQRKLYYRELIARFSYHLALNWNIGEENTNTDAQRKAFAQYFYDNDPYRHNVVIHTYPQDRDHVYPALLGSASTYTGISLQGGNVDFSDTFGMVKKWVDQSRSSGKKWVVAVDEPGDPQHALVPDSVDSERNNARKNALWATLLAGGAGNEWYFGYGHAHSDLTCEDFRSRDRWWDHCRYALRFFKNNNIPVADMINDNSKSSNGSDYCLYKNGEVYVIFLKNGGTTSLNLNGIPGTFNVRWYDPRNGGALQNGSVNSVSGEGNRSLGNAPSSSSSDWVIFVSKNDSTPGNNAPNAVISNNISGGVAPITVSFNGSGSFDSDGSIVSYAWNFGDGSISSATNPSHTYNNAGTYVVTLTVTDDDGASDSTSKTITVTENGGGGPTVTSLVLVNADTDQDIAVLSNGYQINIANTPNVNVRAEVNGSPSKVNFNLSGTQSHTQSEGVAPYALFGDNGGDYLVWTPVVGSYTVVVDADGQGALTLNFSAVNSVPPANEAPQAAIQSNAQGGEAPVTINFIGSNSNDVDGTIVSYAWDFGDGNNASVANPSHTFDEAGVYTVSLTVTDDDGATDTETTTITVTEPANENPNAVISSNANGGEAPVAINFNGSASSDSDGSIASYAWDFGDGNNSSVANPSHTYSTAGTYTVSLTVTDNEGATDVATTVITVTEPYVGPNIEKIFLVNADTDEDIAELTNNYEINIAQTPNVNIRAEVSGTVYRAVRLELTGAETHTQDEAVAPYALFGDESGDFNIWNPTIGSYALTVNADGLSILSLNFTVVDDADIPGEVVVAINAGGRGFIANDGTIYNTDKDYNPLSRTYYVSAAIDGTEEDELYRSERYAPNLQYDVAVPDGEYDLTLHFAEIYFNDSGKRVFDIIVEGETVRNDVDLYAITQGRFIAHDIIVPVTIIDGQLNVLLAASVENAKLSGLRLERVPVFNQ